MPCDRRVTVSLNLKNVEDSLIAEVLGELGLSGVSVRDGQLFGARYQLTQENVGKVKQKVAEKVIKKQAAKLGWRVEKQKDGKIKIRR